MLKNRSFSTHSNFERVLPNLFDIFKAHLVKYPTPRNLNVWWSGGALLGFFFVLQVITGLLLTLHFTPDVLLAFLSVEHIMRDISNGWIFRYAHANGASILFFLLYIHIGRSLYYGSYQSPREKVWYTGCLLLVIFMAEAFTGYVLPWGQMGFWGATVITNLVTSVPFVGNFLVEWIWGGFSVDNPVLHRFYILHVFVLPAVIAGLILLHLFYLHKVGSNNPLAFESNRYPTPFAPYFGFKDFMYFFAMFFVYIVLIFFYSNMLGHPDNYIPANPMVTPAHIVPEWYFLPFYAILRSVPSKLGGIVVTGIALLCLAILPLLSNIKQFNRRPVVFRYFFKYAYWLFIANFFILGWIGSVPVEFPFVFIGQFATAFYFITLFSMVLSAILDDYTGFAV